MNREQLEFFYSEIMGLFGWGDEEEETGVDPLLWAREQLAQLRADNHDLSAELREQYCEKCNTVYPTESCRKKDSCFLWCPNCYVPTMPLAIREKRTLREDSDYIVAENKIFLDGMNRYRAELDELRLALKVAIVCNADQKSWGVESPFQKRLDDLVGKFEHEEVSVNRGDIAEGYCCYCEIYLPDAAAAREHGKTCEKHPLRAELDKKDAALDNLKSAPSPFGKTDSVITQEYRNWYAQGRIANLPAFSLTAHPSTQEDK